MLKSQGETREQKANNFWIKEETEQSLLSTQTTHMQQFYTSLKNKKPLVTAMVFLHRFYLKESVFIYDLEQMSLAALFLAQK